MHGEIKAREDAKLTLRKMKSTERKVQLNVRINEKLLYEIKYGAKIRGLRINEYCESPLKIQALTNHHIKITLREEFQD